MSILSKKLAMMLGIMILTIICMLGSYSGVDAQKLDVPYVSTPHVVVEKMLDVANVGPGDYVIDLGCGDGRIVIEAARRGAYGHGLDLDPRRIKEAERNAVNAGVHNRTIFLQADIFKSDFSRANVITMYLLTSVNLKLRSRLLETLEPGTKIVSHNFDMGDWKPDRHIRVGDSNQFFPKRLVGQPDQTASPDMALDNRVIDELFNMEDTSLNMAEWLVSQQNRLEEIELALELQDISESIDLQGHDIFCWIVPARVGGTWQWETEDQNFEMKVNQRFQEIYLELHSGEILYNIESKALKGGRIGFTAINPDNEHLYVFSGFVKGNRIVGKVQIHESDNRKLKDWSAKLQ